jgi:hypothetical protein
MHDTRLREKFKLETGGYVEIGGEMFVVRAG